MFKVGDRIILLYTEISSTGYCSNRVVGQPPPMPISRTKEGGKAEIIEILDNSPDIYKNWKKYKIRLLGTKNIIGSPVEKWVSPDDFKIDIQYLRNEKINTIINNSNS